MNAKEARNITENTLAKLGPSLREIYARIELTAKNGDTSISYPFITNKNWEQLEKDGYEVSTYQDDLITISW